MRSIQHQIIQLHKSGKNYDQIAKELKCSKGAISYHLGNGQKEKTLNRTRKRRTNPIISKLEAFLSSKPSTYISYPVHKTNKLIQLKIEVFTRNRQTGEYMKPSFTVEDVINKFGSNPKCYLTGVSIDITKPRTYAFDHIIPVSRGGDNSLSNLGLCTKLANAAKCTMTHGEFLEFCKLVVEHNKLQS